MFPDKDSSRSRFLNTNINGQTGVGQHGDQRIDAE
jgi:hypothetical protein